MASVELTGDTPFVDIPGSSEHTNHLIDQLETEYMVLLSASRGIVGRSLDAVGHTRELKQDMAVTDVEVTEEELLARIFLGGVDFVATDHLQVLSRFRLISRREVSRQLSSDPLMAHLEARKSTQARIEGLIDRRTGEDDSATYVDILDAFRRGGRVVLSAGGLAPGHMLYLGPQLAGMLSELQVTQGLSDEGLPSRLSTVKEDMSQIDVVTEPMITEESITKAVGLQVKTGHRGKNRQQVIPLEFNTSTTPPTVKVRKAKDESRIRLNPDQTKELADFVITLANAA